MVKDEVLHILMEYAEKGDLDQMIKDQRKKQSLMAEGTILEIFS